MEYDAYRSLLQQLDDLIAIFEEHPDERTRERAIALLTGIDALHREALVRLVARVRDFAGDDVVDRLTADPIVETLLGLYGLAELDLPPEPEARPPAPTGVSGFVPLERLTVRRRKDEQAAPASGPAAEPT